jgi:hypothetical protein
MEILFFSLALAVLGTAAFFAWKNRFDTKQCIASITLGVFFATFFMVLPTQWVKEGKEVFCEPLYAGLSSLLYSLKALGGRQDIGQLESMALPGVLKAVYIGLGYLCFTLAPILASSLILTFVGDTGEKLRFWLKKSPKCYVFSEINENALAIAKGIQTKTGKKTLVFCNGKSADKALVVKAKKAGGVVLHKPCDALAVTGRFDTYEFCLISADEDSNIRLAETLIAKYSDNRKAGILVNAFAESGTNVTLLENILKEKDTRIELRCIDEIALFCNHLVYKHPLYNTKSHTVSVAIVGCGRLGMRMLKTVYWAGQIAGRTLKIRVYDKQADACKDAFYGDCPGLEGSEVIQFVKADVGSASFREQLLEHSGDATYIVVAMGSDQLNLSVAEDLYRIYRRHFNFRDDRMPEIFTRIRSQAKCDNYSANPEFLQKRHVHLFGTTAELYSEQTLFNTELENLAFAVHLTYNGQMPPDKSTEKYAKSIKEFKTGEYGRRSSMAAALHFSAKLSMCDKITQTGGTILTADNLRIYARELKDDPQFRQRLVQNEHDRWNAFMLTEGYLPATEDQMHLYAEAVDSHKDDLSMLHPCITDWDALDKLEAQYNRTYGKDKTFKKYDIDIVEKLPLIWEVAQGL